MPSLQTPLTATPRPVKTPLISPHPEAGQARKRRNGAERTRPRLGIYAGAGASHSWLWLVEACESLGLTDLDFLYESDLASSGLEDLDALCVSGDDAFALGGPAFWPGAASTWTPAPGLPLPTLLQGAAEALQLQRGPHHQPGQRPAPNR